MGGQRFARVFYSLGIKASAYLPLVSKMGVVGILYVDFITPHKFSEDDKRILELFADQAAINIQNARLFEAERERADTIQVLQQISKSISETLDLNAILHQIVDGARKLVHADSGVIHLIDEAKEIISESYESPQGSGHLSPRFDQRRGLTWKIYEKGQMVEERDILQAAPEVRERDWGGRRALIGLPLKLVDRVSGVLFLYSNNPRVFTSSEKDLLTTLAEQAALAIDNAQRYEQRAKDIAVLEEINAAITTRSWPEIADLIARKAAEISQADYGGLWLVEDSVLVLGAMHPREVPEGAVPPPQQLPMDDASINGWVARTGEPYSVTSGVNEDRHYRRWREDIESSAAVPLRSHGDVIGTLSIESSEPLAFSDYQLELLQCLADQAAIAIENVRSYERQVSLTSDLKRKLDEFEVYTELGQRVANLEVDQIPRLVYEKMNMIMDLSDAQVQFAFYSETKNEVTFPLAIEQDDGRIIDVVRWGKREPGDGMEGESELVEAFQPRHRDPSIRFGLTEYVIGIRAPVLITQDFEKTANALELNEFQVRVLPKFGIAERPTHSWLGVPMIAQGRVIGVISIQSLEQDHAFDQGHVEVLSAVANQAAVAIENARLQAALVAQKQLTTLGTAIAALQHRISNTLSVIVPNVTRLRGRVRTSDKTISEALDIIERNARYMSGILERIQEPLRETEIREVDINAVLNEVAATARDKWLGVPGVFPISLELMLDNSLPLIQAPIGQLTEVFQNLLDNAYRVMANKGGEICISTFHTSAMLCARVCDTGPGIPPKIQQRLFEKPVPSTQPGGGAGLGLWLSRLMLQSIGGNVIIESTKTAEPTGTTMLVQIPVAPAREEVEI